jgi:hypothetical protein
MPACTNMTCMQARAERDWLNLHALAPRLVVLRRDAGPKGLQLCQCVKLHLQLQEQRQAHVLIACHNMLRIDVRVSD